ncbi:MAG TPA: hypothetical protein VJM80_08070 [bacterium]|nr:hypothetical protein [bacterium]
MKNRLGWLFVILLGVAAVGMGTTGRGPGEIPIPGRDFSATIIDRQNIATPVTQISFNGQATLQGNRGEGSLTVPFDRIKTISFSDADALKRRARITFKDSSETVDMVVDGQLKVYGKSRYGAFEIITKNIQRIDF